MFNFAAARHFHLINSQKIPIRSKAKQKRTKKAGSVETCVGRGLNMQVKMELYKENK